MTTGLAAALGFGAGVAFSAVVVAVTLAEDGGARRLYGRLRARRAARVHLPPPGPPAPVEAVVPVRRLRAVPPPVTVTREQLTGPAFDDLPARREPPLDYGTALARRGRAAGQHRPIEERE